VPVPIEAATVLVVVLITETVFELAFATKTSLPSVLTATPCGPEPTDIVDTTVLVAAFITDTVFEILFET